MERMKRKQAVLNGPFETATVKDIAVYDVDAFFAPQRRGVYRWSEALYSQEA